MYYYYPTNRQATASPCSGGDTRAPHMMMPVSYQYPITQTMSPQQQMPMPQLPMMQMPMQGGFPGGAAFPTQVGGNGDAGTGAGAGEESYIENILRFNRGKIATFYFTYQNNEQWNARIYRGRVETAGRDHIIISDPQTGRRYVLLMVNLDWVEFDGPIAYIPPALPPGTALTTGVGGDAAGTATGAGTGTGGGAGGAGAIS